MENDKILLNLNASVDFISIVKPYMNTEEIIKLNKAVVQINKVIKIYKDKLEEEVKCNNQ